MPIDIDSGTFVDLVAVTRGSNFGTIQTSLEVALVSLLIYLSGLSCTLSKIKILDSHINCHIGLICYLINSTLANYYFFFCYLQGVKK